MVGFLYDFFFFFDNVFLFYVLVVGVCGLSLVVTSWGYSLVAKCRTLIAMASLVEHRL